MKSDLLAIAVRAHAVPEANRRRRSKRKTSRSRKIRQADWPDSVLVFDTETTTDHTQALVFGSYRYYRWDHGRRRLRCEEEGLFYTDGFREAFAVGYLPFIPGDLLKIVATTSIYRSYVALRRARFSR